MCRTVRAYSGGKVYLHLDARIGKRGDVEQVGKRTAMRFIDVVQMGFLDPPSSKTSFTFSFVVKTQSGKR